MVHTLGKHHEGGYWRVAKFRMIRPDGSYSSSVETPARSARPPLELLTKGVNRFFGKGPVMGADPEVFIAKGASRVAAFDVLPSKQDGLRTESAHDGMGRHNWFWDGYQAETALPAVACHTSFAYWWQGQLKKLCAKGLSVVPGSVWRVPKESLQAAGEAQVGLGCSPSFNAYGSSGKQVANPRELPVRFAGGHIHFEVNLPSLEELGVDATYVVRSLDAILGIPYTAMFRNYSSVIRRKYYGLAGEFRTPKHGLEYRVLDNGWLLHPQAFQLTLDLARHAFNLGRTRLANGFLRDFRLTQNIIDTNDVRSAADFVKFHREFYDAWLDVRYGAVEGFRGGKKSFWQAITQGIDTVLPTFGKDVFDAWGIGTAPSCKIANGADNYAAGNKNALWNELP